MARIPATRQSLFKTHSSSSRTSWKIIKTSSLVSWALASVRTTMPHSWITSRNVVLTLATSSTSTLTSQITVKRWRVVCLSRSKWQWKVRRTLSSSWRPPATKISSSIWTRTTNLLTISSMVSLSLRKSCFLARRSWRAATLKASKPS